MRRAALPLVLLAALAAMPIAAPLPAAPATQPPCAGVGAPTLFAQWSSQLENLAFDGAGAAYVSDFGAGRLLRATPEGVLAPVANVPIHGLTFGPDGLLYVGTRGGEVWRFSSLAPPAHDVVATGLPGANGMAFDAAGDLFVTNPLGGSPPYVVKLPAGDFAAWSGWNPVYGVNGVWRDPADDSLLGAVTGDQSSPIVRLSTSDIQSSSVVAELSLGAATLQPGAHPPRGDARSPLPKGLDDLALGPDGRIFVAAHVTGEVLRVEPATGEACVVASGFDEPTSVRFAGDDFGALSGRLFVTDMGGLAVSALVGPGEGAIWSIDVDAS